MTQGLLQRRLLLLLLRSSVGLLKVASDTAPLEAEAAATCACVQGYSYIQRPALTSAAVAVAGPGGLQLPQTGTGARHRSPAGATVMGLPVGPGGKLRPTKLPAFPQVTARLLLRCQEALQHAAALSSSARQT